MLIMIFRTFFDSYGVFHQCSCPYTPEQNGVAERKHHHIVEIALSLLSKSSVPLRFWFYAFACAVFLINRLPSTSLGNRSPYEVLFSTYPNYNHLRVFGCACYPLLRPYATNKLQPRTKQCVFLGYPLGYKGYLYLDPVSERIYISCHVVFDEHVFPFASASPSTSPSHSPSPSSCDFALPIILQSTSRLSSALVCDSMAGFSNMAAPNESVVVSPDSTLAVDNITSAPNLVIANSRTEHTLMPPTTDLVVSPTNDNSIVAPTVVGPLVGFVLPSTTNTYPMQTRLKSGISKKKVFLA